MELAQLKNFVFTINNPKQPKEYYLNILHSMGVFVNYIVIGEEIGENGTPHFQGFCMLTKKTRFKRVHDLLDHAHIERMRGTATQAANYCKKDGKFMEEGELIDAVSIAQRSKERYLEMHRLAKLGLWDELDNTYPSESLRFRRQLGMVHVEAMMALSCEKKCAWFYGRPGTGKSRFVNGYDANIYYKNCNKWWDNYNVNRNKVVVIDEFDPSHHVLGSHLKRWADRYPVLCETKGGAMYPCYETLMITSNYSIDEIWKDDVNLQDALKRRFHVYQVMGFDIDPEGRISIRVNEDGDPFKNKILTYDNLFT